MAPGKAHLRIAASLLSLLAAGCSSGSSGGNVFVSATQNLTLDASGRTTVFEFVNALPTLTPGHFESDDTPIATGVVVAGNQATVTWDEIVNPSHQVRIVGVGGIASTFHAVATSDASAPTFVVSGATQTTGLGGDSFTVQFSGPNVIESTAEDLSNWTLTVNGQALDLSGSSFDLNPTTQLLTGTLGTAANLHATFSLTPSGVASVAGTSLAAGAVAGAVTSPDVTAPTLTSVQQNLAESEFGMVVDFTFSEAMDPVFATQLGNFSAGFPVFATQVEQPSESVLRVTFNAPMIPGSDTVDLSGLMDAHGVALGASTENIVAGSTVANGFQPASPVVSTVANTGGDTLVIQLVQAVDPDTAEDSTRWRFESPTGNAIDLTNADLSYDLMAKTLTITLNDDDLLTGDTFLFGAAAGAPFPLDVDGQDFTSSTTGSVTGDVTAPAVNSVTQNRTIDSSGLTLDVFFGEDVRSTNADQVGTYTFSNGAVATSATQLAGLDTVRLVTDILVVPGEHTMSVVAAITDLAGNATTTGATAVVSTDVQAPSEGTPVVFAQEGENNDTITVVFDDTMIAAEVTNPANWTLQSPAAVFPDTSLASVSYNPGTGEAVLTFDGGDGINLKRLDDFAVTLSNMRDIGGNMVAGAPIVGAVAGEQNYPTVESVWVETATPSNIHVRFSEPCDELDDISLGRTRYVLRDAGGVEVTSSLPTVAIDGDGRGVTLSFASGATAGSHTLDVLGVEDLAGNSMFPALLLPIASQDGAEPALDAGLSIHNAVPGVDNDELTVVFDRSVSGWELFNAGNWTLTDGSVTADFSLARFAFDGDRTVDVVFEDGYSLGSGPFTLTVDNLESRQGVSMSASSVDTTVADAGTDATAPGFGSTGARLDAQDAANSVLIEFDESVDATDMVDTANYLLGGVTAPDSVVSLDTRTVRATWTAGVSLPATIDVTVEDVAGNAALASTAIQAQDTGGPSVLFVQGVSVPGSGADYVTVQFNRPVESSSGLDADNYTLTVDGDAQPLTDAVLSYDVETSTVTIALPDTVDLATGASINVMVDSVENQAGLAISPAGNVNGAVVGDTTAPTLVSAFVNYHADPNGGVIDVQFSEDVEADLSTFAFSGGQGVGSVTRLRDDTYRLTMIGALGGSTLDVASVLDPAGNEATDLAITPVQ